MTHKGWGIVQPQHKQTNDYCWKCGLSLQGIKVETYPDRPVSAPVTTNDQTPRPVRPDSGEFTYCN